MRCPPSHGRGASVGVVTSAALGAPSPVGSASADQLSPASCAEGIAGPPKRTLRNLVHPTHFLFRSRPHRCPLPAYRERVKRRGCDQHVPLPAHQRAAGNPPAAAL